MATTANPWSKPGGWALAAEEEDAAQEIQKQQQLAAKPIIPASAFPDLAAAAAAPKGKKKTKGQKLSLGEFATYDAPKQSSSAFQPTRLTQDEIAVLPTGPRERTAEELAGARGFRSYGTREEQPRRQRESSFGPPSSRADDTDDWGAAKKFTPASNGGFDRRGGGGGFPDSSSRADEVDNWASRKAFVPSDGGRRLPERRSSAFETMGGEGRADTDNWAKRKETTEVRKFGSPGGSFDSLRDRRGGGSGSSGDSPTAGSGPVERPRLNLQPRTLPVTLPPPPPVVNNNVEQQNGEVLAKPEIAPRPKGVNPFGNARPREEVLKEKGQDYKELDEKLDEKLEAAKIEEQRPGKRGFGTGGWRGGPQEERVDRTWRKPAESETSRPTSAEIKEDGAVEEAEANKDDEAEAEANNA